MFQLLALGGKGHSMLDYIPLTGYLRLSISGDVHSKNQITLLETRESRSK